MRRVTVALDDRVVVDRGRLVYDELTGAAL
jgi:hypothetical protein